MCGSRKYPYPHPPPPMEGYWKFQGGGGSRGANSQEVCVCGGGGGGRRVTYFQRVQEHCLRETYQYRICDLVNQQIDELQFILVYSNAICTFSGRF